MDITDKIDLMVDTTVTGDIATNTAKGNIDIISRNKKKKKIKKENDKKTYI